MFSFGTVLYDGYNILRYGRNIIRDNLLFAYIRTGFNTLKSIPWRKVDRENIGGIVISTELNSEIWGNLCEDLVSLILDHDPVKSRTLSRDMERKYNKGFYYDFAITKPLTVSELEAYMDEANLIVSFKCNSDGSVSVRFFVDRRVQTTKGNWYIIGLGFCKLNIMYLLRMLTIYDEDGQFVHHDWGLQSFLLRRRGIPDRLIADTLQRCLEMITDKGLRPKYICDNAKCLNLCGEYFSKEIEASLYKEFEESLYKYLDGLRSG